MKNVEEIIDYLEKELKILALEDLNEKAKDTQHAVRYKSTQIGKRIAYEKMLAFINDTHNTAYPPRIKKKVKEVEDKRKPIIVCN